jgi:hypothetical protein
MISTNTQIANLSLFHEPVILSPHQRLASALGSSSELAFRVYSIATLPVSCTAARCLRLRLPRCVHATCVTHRAVTHRLFSLSSQVTNLIRLNFFNPSAIFGLLGLDSGRGPISYKSRARICFSILLPVLISTCWPGGGEPSCTIPRSIVTGKVPI